MATTKIDLIAVLKMKYLHGTPLLANHFTWIGNTGSAEVSDFGPGGLPLHQVWPGACDAGFTLASHRTGELVTFVECGRIMAEDEVAGWVYRSIDRRTGRIDKSPFGMTIKIFND